MRLGHLELTVCIALATPLAAANATTYTFTTLNVPGATATASAVAYGINNAGQIAGTTSTKTPGMFGVTQGFSYDPKSGTYTVFSDPRAATPFSYTTATGINNAGQIVGTSFETSPAYSFYTAFVRDIGTGVVTDVPSLSTTQTAGINDLGQIVGTSSSSRYSIGFLLDSTTDQYINLAVFGPTSAGMSSLPTYDFQPTGINDTGQIVGRSIVYDLNTRVSTPFTYLGKPVNSLTGISNTGLIVGNYLTSGFIFDENAATFTFISDPLGTSTSIQGVNDTGQVVGSYVDGNGITEAFFATPQAASVVPEPGSIAVLGVGLFGAGYIRRRNSNLAQAKLMDARAGR